MEESDAVHFTLPVGYRDREGVLHRGGILRPATARDEVRTLGDFRVHLRPDLYLDVALGRTVTRLGSLEAVDAGVFGRLDEADRSFLEILYREINGYPLH
jgi:hypothetical protein